jgi:hypothetical protein
MPYFLGGHGNLPGFDATQDQIRHSDLCRPIRSLNRVDGKIPTDTVDLETSGPNGIQVFPPCDKSDFVARLGQTSSEVSPDAPGPEHGNFHWRSP